MASRNPEPPLDPAAAQIVARIRKLMLLAGATTFIGVAAIFGIIGYRVFRGEGSAPPMREMTAVLPAAARVITTALSGDQLAVTLEVGGETEIMLFDARTLAATGRLRLQRAR